MEDETRPHAEQQGDGQPENVRDLEDESGGAALAGEARDERTDEGAREARGLRSGAAPSRDRDAGTHAPRLHEPP